MKVCSKRKKSTQNDYWLKMAFEAIFKKYERNLDGLVYEIDLEAGEIVAENGRLRETEN